MARDEIGMSLRRSNRSYSFNFRNNEDSTRNDAYNYAVEWAEIERLPTRDRLKSFLFDDDDSDQGKSVIDVTKLGPVKRHMLMEKLIKHIEHDNLKLLRKVRNRIDRVGIKLPTIEVRYKKLRVEAECEVVYGKALPTLWNSLRSIVANFAKLWNPKSHRAKICIINDVTGIIKPGRMTLLLGPPGCGKTTLLKALSGTLDSSLKVTGEISYNGYKLEEFVPRKTSAYIGQYDQHIAEMTVRETLDFSARCQGVGVREDILSQVCRREKEAGIIPDPDIDAYMKAISAKGLTQSIQTDHILKILGLDICADTMVGDAMIRGISGGQKRRLTSGEMAVGPVNAFFMDEITNGLDSSTAFQIISCIRHLVQVVDATALISLLQPAPETFDLFDDIMLMAEGKIVYHGPRENALEFFDECGFRCPDRKGVADFLQEVISKKDQEQYWHHNELPYSYVSVDMFSRKFKEYPLGKELYEEVSLPVDKSKTHNNALSFSVYSLTKWELFKVCLSREYLLMRRNSFVYIFKAAQLVIIALITMTTFLRTRMAIDVLHANYYMGALFYGLVVHMMEGLSELTMTVTRLEIFYKQKELCFYPAWAYAIPAALSKIPLSLIDSLIWTAITYYVIGYSPQFWRFLRQWLLYFAMNVTALSMFRLLGSIFRTLVASMVAASFVVFLVSVFCGFMISRSSLPTWLRWGFWLSPLTYGQTGISLNEFLAPRWQQMLPINTTIGHAILQSRGVDFHGYFFWLCLGGLAGFALLFNIGLALILTFFKGPGSSRTIISHEKLAQIQRNENSYNSEGVQKKSANSGKIVLPFKPLTLTFQNVNYYVDTPTEMQERGFAERKLQLLSDISGSLRPGVLTALMGVSGAGKTTLMDVLAGRKTTGYIEGEIKVGGYPKVQETFARISGYCEQSDIHSPQLTIEESLIFSAWLRLAPEIEAKTKADFVKEVLETVELDEIKDALVGKPGVTGLSNEQRKRLTIAVELVSNPSIIFMDEPTTGLDARAAATVMRAVKNVVDTGRTIVCTIHQPSIHIFEAFDELILLKAGGRLIYAGPLGQHSGRIIEYFEAIPGVPKIKNNYNPATWALEVTSPSTEAELGVDFAQIYKESTLYQNNMDLVNQCSSPAPGSRDLHFPSRFAQNGWVQFKYCLWKQHLSYWRTPSYNLTRIAQIIVASFLFGILLWDKGKKINNQQDISNMMSGLFIAVLFLGINNCSPVIPYVTTERNVMCRERFAGMYSPLAYAVAQVTIEIPYQLIQAVSHVIIVYPMIGLDATAHKIFWYFYAIFSSLLYFNYLGMMLASVTPNEMVAAILSAPFYEMYNLFAGYLLPQPQIPGWWIWLHYAVPTSWTLNGVITSQYGDLDKTIMVFEEPMAVSAFLRSYFGFHHDRLPLVAVMVIVFPILFASLFAFFIGKLNFQRR